MLVKGLNLKCCVASNSGAASGYSQQILFISSGLGRLGELEIALLPEIRFERSQPPY
jgi:hypothetical protein